MLGLLAELPKDRVGISLPSPASFAGIAASVERASEVVGVIMVDVDASAADASGDAPPAPDAKLDEAMGKIEAAVDKSLLRALCAASGAGHDISNLLVAESSLLGAADVGMLSQLKNPVSVVSQGFVGERAEACPATSVDSAAALTACLRSDRPDGLFTTVVSDEAGITMGLVYSNAESIRAAVSGGRGVYWSRSRGGLWRKGDTSGAWQQLLAVSFDCDGDALMFNVKQNGSPPAFCHLNTYGCWGHMQRHSGVRGIPALERTVQVRKRDT